MRFRPRTLFQKEQTLFYTDVREKGTRATPMNHLASA